MIKTIICLFILMAVLFQALDKTIIILNFQINKDYYAKYLCENREKPMMHCNGKCCMCKQLEKAQKKESSPSFPSKEKNETLWYNQYSDKFLFNPKLTFLTTCQKIADSGLLPEPYMNSVFHPPKFG